MKGRKRAANETEKLFTCTQCDCGAFETRKLLKHHIHDAHDGVGLEILALKCAEPDCMFQTATQKLLNEHRKDAHGIAPSFKCRVLFSRNYVTDFLCTRDYIWVIFYISVTFVNKLEIFPLQAIYFYVIS